jgi:DNA-binding response OmpR family regulator
MENSPTPTRRILVVDADPALLGLLGAWLADHGEIVVQRGGEPARRDVDLVVVDVAFPRLVQRNGLRELAEAHAGTPLIALSPTFFGGIASQGAVAQSLGVAAVLPKPIQREALLGTVSALLADR